MIKPLIGLSAGRQPRGTAAGRLQDVTIGCPDDYRQAVERAGGAVVLLPPTRDAEAVERAMEAVDGLILTGGGDLDPELLGEEPHPNIRAVDAERDAAEVTMIRAAIRNNLPVLGVCKGAQMLNVVLGGGLVQHIDDRAPGAVGHWQRCLTRGVTHTIEVAPDTILARVLGEGRRRVNSFHHQALGEPAPGTIASARALDGVVEAIESSEGAPLLGVQFHPELLIDSDPAFLSIFDWLVSEGAARRMR